MENNLKTIKELDKEAIKRVLQIYSNAVDEEIYRRFADVKMTIKEIVSIFNLFLKERDDDVLELSGDETYINSKIRDVRDTLLSCIIENSGPGDSNSLMSESIQQMFLYLNNKVYQETTVRSFVYAIIAPLKEKRTYIEMLFKNTEYARQWLSSWINDRREFLQTGDIAPEFIRQTLPTDSRSRHIATMNIDNMLQISYLGDDDFYYNEMIQKNNIHLDNGGHILSV